MLHLPALLVYSSYTFTCLIVRIDLILYSLKITTLFFHSFNPEVIFSVMCISCHVCGNMYDGTTFMDVEGGFKECIDGMNSIKKCPVEDLCCFALREHIAFEFWGRKYHHFNRL